MTNQDTITVELPIEAYGGNVNVAGVASVSREYWRKIAANPNATLNDMVRTIAPAVVAWIERDEWEPLDLPEAGRRIQATLRDGRVETFKVGKVDVAFAWAWVWKADSDDGPRHIQRTPDVDDPDPGDMIAWEYVDEPEPATATVTIDVRANIAGLADDLQAAADAIRAGLTVAGESDG